MSKIEFPINFYHDLLRNNELMRNKTLEVRYVTLTIIESYKVNKLRVESPVVCLSYFIVALTKNNLIVFDRLVL